MYSKVNPWKTLSNFRGVLSVGHCRYNKHNNSTTRQESATYCMSIPGFKSNRFEFGFLVLFLKKWSGVQLVDVQQRCDWHKIKHWGQFAHAEAGARMKGKEEECVRAREGVGGGIHVSVHAHYCMGSEKRGGVNRKHMQRGRGQMLTTSKI